MNTPDPAVLDSDVTPSAPPPKQERRLHSKIAQLPKVLRDQVNSMLDDGAPYALIVEKLRQSTAPPLPFPISEMNISRWKDTGFDHYLAQQERFAYVRQDREAAREMVDEDDTTTLPEATLQIIASHYYDILVEFSPDSLKQELGTDPLKYTRFLNVFARLAREILLLKKHREALAALKSLDPKRKLSDNEQELFFQRVEQCFKAKLPRGWIFPDPEPAPPTPEPDTPNTPPHPLTP